jgi:unsaturated chondroitin disaccharide hydrolase
MPSSSSTDGTIGLGALNVTSNGGMAVILRLNPSGYFQAHNGSGYAYSTKLRYTKGVAYEVRMVIDMTREQYSVYVKSPGMAEVRIANNFDFRASAPPGPLTTLASASPAGGFKHTVPADLLA